MTQDSTLIQLIGSNPLPNYLSAMSLGVERVLLIYSPQTKWVMENLGRLYSKKSIIVEERMVPSATNPLCFRNIIDSGMGSHLLDYTGGTKVMSVHTYYGWMEKGGSDERASYVDSVLGEIRFADGSSRPLDVEVTLDDLVIMHGLRRFEERDIEISENRYEELNNQLVECLYELELSPVSDLVMNGYEFEEWIANVIYHSGIAQQDKIHTGVKIFQRDGLFELDLVVTRKYRTFVMSCSMIQDYRKCKTKAFEVYRRSQQLGGVMVKNSLLTLLDIVSSDYGSPLSYQADNLEYTMSEHWMSPVQFKSFGILDVNQWAGVEGNSPNFASLREWFDLNEIKTPEVM